MKIYIYSCVTGGYDTCPPNVAARDSFDDCVLFADNISMQSSAWKLSALRSPDTLIRGDLINRYHKFFAESLFPDADISIYIDGNIEVLQSLHPLVDQFASSNAVFGCLIHPQRKYLLDELRACKRLGKFKYDDEMRVDSQLSSYMQDGFPFDFPLYSAGVLFRRHGLSSALNEAMSMWWQQINQYTCRDQLSLPYVLWKSKLSYMAFDLDIFENPYFLRRPHSYNPGFANRLKKYINCIAKKIGV